MPALGDSLTTKTYHQIRESGIASEVIGTGISGLLRTITVLIGHPLHVTRTVQNMPGNNQGPINILFELARRGKLLALYSGLGANLGKVLSKELYRYPLTGPAFRKKVDASLSNEIKSLSPYLTDLIMSALVSIGDATAGGALDRIGTYQVSYYNNTRKHASALQALREIVRNEGALKLLKGAPSLFTMHFFSWISFFSLRKEYASDKSIKPTLVLLYDLMIGITMAPILNAYEVVRHQETAHKNSGASTNLDRSMFKAACAIAREQGAMKFFSGLPAKAAMYAMNTGARGLAIEAGEYIARAEERETTFQKEGVKLPERSLR